MAVKWVAAPHRPPIFLLKLAGLETDQQPDTIKAAVPQAARAGLQIARLMAAVSPRLS
ncbi:hypothetical protein ACVBEH_04405 [Roseateles sp. GG27B]